MNQLSVVKFPATTPKGSEFCAVLKEGYLGHLLMDLDDLNGYTIQLRYSRLCRSFWPAANKDWQAVNQDSLLTKLWEDHSNQALRFSVQMPLKPRSPMRGGTRQLKLKVLLISFMTFFDIHT